MGHLLSCICCHAQRAHAWPTCIFLCGFNSALSSYFAIRDKPHKPQGKPTVYILPISQFPWRLSIGILFFLTEKNGKNKTKTNFTNDLYLLVFKAKEIPVIIQLILATFPELTEHGGCQANKQAKWLDEMDNCWREVYNASEMRKLHLESSTKSCISAQELRKLMYSTPRTWWLLGKQASKIVSWN